MNGSRRVASVARVMENTNRLDFSSRFIEGHEEHEVMIFLCVLSFVFFVRFVVDNVFVAFEVK